MVHSHSGIAERALMFPLLSFPALNHQFSQVSLTRSLKAHDLELCSVK